MVQKIRIFQILWCALTDKKERRSILCGPLLWTAPYAMGIVQILN